MTTPSATNPEASTTDTAAAKRTADADPQPATGGPDEMEELARTRDEAEDRARELLAALVLQESRNGSHDERARQLASAADSSEDAVAGLVQGVTTIVRSLVPAVLVCPEEVIETTYALADQGLRVTRRLALVLTQSMRSLVTT